MRLGLLAVAVALVCCPARAAAQVPTAITSSGLGTTVTPPAAGDTVYQITGGTRPGNGPNLFHSFGRFSIGAADTALFSNTTPGLVTRNILSRVTGGEVSSIFGTLDTASYPGANFFLLNPAGVVFGPTAVLNVGGSFHVSTADYLRFADGATFCVAACPGGQPPVLSVADPAAFGFLGPTTGSISFEGGFHTVPAGQTLSMVGGDVSLTGTSLSASGGRLHIASAAGATEISTSTLGATTPDLGGVQILAGSMLDTSGDPGGTVVIRGGQIVIDASAVTATTFGETPGATIGIDVAAPGGTVTVTNNASLATDSFAGGRGGHVELTADAITFSNFALAVARTSGPGRGGDLRITANAIDVTSGSAVSAATEFGGGQGGDFRITTKALTVDGGIVTTGSVFGDNDLLGTGAGDLTIDARGGTVAVRGGGGIESVNFALTGPGGNIAIEADSVSVTGQDEFGSVSRIGSTTFVDGPGGDIAITAKILTIGNGSSVQSSSGGLGRTGNIDVSVGTLNIIDGGTLGSFNAGSPEPGGNVRVDVAGVATVSGTGLDGRPSAIVASSAGTTIFGEPAPVGMIDLRVGSLLLRNDALIQSGDIAAQGGDIAIVARDAITISDRAGVSSVSLLQDIGTVSITGETLAIDNGFINTSALDAGRAGAISIDVGRLTLTRGGQIASSSIVLATGAGGNIGVRADSVTIAGTSPSGASVLPIPFRDFLIDPGTGASDPASGLFSTASSANPDALLAAGGSIDVTASSLTVRDGGKMSVATTGAAPGGSITVRAPGGDVTLSGGGALFSSASGSARGGDINVVGDRVRLLSGGLVSADSTGTAEATAGSIDITFGRLFEMDGATMTTQSALADGGNISISSTGSVFRLLDSRITTSVQSGIGAGGNITIGSVGHPIDFVVLAGSEIRADAFGGPGGNIDVVANVFLSDSSLLSASSALSAPGVINIQADVTDVSGEVTQLPSDIVQAATLLRASCTARLAAGRTSSLVVAGREGVPPEPDGLLSSPLPELNTILGSSPFEDDEQADSFPRWYRVSLDSRCAR